MDIRLGYPFKPFSLISGLPNSNKVWRINSFGFEQSQRARVFPRALNFQRGWIFGKAVRIGLNSVGRLDPGAESFFEPNKVGIGRFWRNLGLFGGRPQGFSGPNSKFTRSKIGFKSGYLGIFGLNPSDHYNVSPGVFWPLYWKLFQHSKFWRRSVGSGFTC